MAQRRNSEHSEINIDDILGEDTNQTPYEQPISPLDEPEPIPEVPLVPEEEIPLMSNQRSGTLWQGFQGVFLRFKDFWGRKTKFLKNIHRCPYCFDEVDKRNTRNLEIRIGAHIKKSAFGNTESTQRPTQIPFCSSCDHDLPTDFFRSKSKSIAVIGGVNSGKSTYITVLIDLLLTHTSLINDLGLHSLIVNQEGKDLFNSQKATLIENQQKLAGTVASESPILIRINSSKKSQSLFLSFFDTKGEEFKSVEGILEKHPHVFNTDAILFLLNPLDIEGIFKQLKDEDEEQGHYSQFNGLNNITEITQNVHDVFERRGLIKSGQALKIPVAFGFSRGDEIEEVANIYLPEDREEEYIDINDIKSDLTFSSEDLTEFLADTDAGLVKNIQQNFSRFRFFPVSPMGTRLTNDSYNEYTPKGVLNPILWILNELKFI